jgi:hypothetical protein
MTQLLPEKEFSGSAKSRCKTNQQKQSNNGAQIIDHSAIVNSLLVPFCCNGGTA